MWSAKIKCISSEGTWVVGKIYNVINGNVEYEKGRYTLNCFSSIDDLNRFFSSKFELVTEELPQPHKSMLKNGDYVVTKDKKEYMVSLKFNGLITSFL